MPLSKLAAIDTTH